MTYINKFLTQNKTKQKTPHCGGRAFNLSTWEKDPGGSLGVQGQLSFGREFQATQCYVVRPCLKTTKARVDYKHYILAPEKEMQVRSQGLPHALKG